MNIRLIENERDCSDGYVISCFILPFVSRGLLESERFSKPPCVVLVRTNDESALQVWHVLAMRKGREAASFRHIDSVSLALPSASNELRYESKRLLCVTGNVPSRFVAALSRGSTAFNDLDVLLATNPALALDTSPVIVVTR